MTEQQDKKNLASSITWWDKNTCVCLGQAPLGCHLTQAIMCFCYVVAAGTLPSLNHQVSGYLKSHHFFFFWLLLSLLLLLLLEVELLKSNFIVLGLTYFLGTTALCIPGNAEMQEHFKKVAFSFNISQKHTPHLMIYVLWVEIYGTFFKAFTVNSATLLFWTVLWCPFFSVWHSSGS